MHLITISVTTLLLYILSTCIILAHNCLQEKRNAPGKSGKAKQKRSFCFRRNSKGNSIASSYSQTQYSDPKKSEPLDLAVHTAKPFPPMSASTPVDNQKPPEKIQKVVEEKPKTEKQEFLPYPPVKSPTLSAKRRREEELQEEKKRKIAEGFYQPRSDEDDTLEKVNSLKMEQSEKTKSRVRRVDSHRNSSRRRPISAKGSFKLPPTQQE
ncbi:hypothetical protein GCK32_017500 [Trichostrongylus colubriformis]|uniref:Uncharacterized protein n=1 Tax=Trichostrongylus colubriformis TaxID=6319 RepID=A0AAN8FAG5_TRICO